MAKKRKPLGECWDINDDACFARERRRRKRGGLKGTKIESHDSTRVAEIKSSTFYRKSANEVNRAACKIIKKGGGLFGGRREVFISDVAKELGHDKVTPSLARLLNTWRRLGWIRLARADLVSALPAAKVAASEVDVDDGLATYHAVVVDCD